MSGKHVMFIGDVMAAVVQGVEEVRTLIGQPPVVVGGLAVMCRLSNPYRATTDSATEVTIEVAPLSGAHVEVGALVAEPGPLVAMKLQAIMNRASAKQGTDLQDIARLLLDGQVRPTALAQLGNCDALTAADIALHIDLWLVDRGCKPDCCAWAAANHCWSSA